MICLFETLEPPARWARWLRMVVAMAVLAFSVACGVIDFLAYDLDTGKPIW